MPFSVAGREFYELSFGCNNLICVLLNSTLFLTASFKRTKFSRKNSRNV